MALDNEASPPPINARTRVARALVIPILLAAAVGSTIAVRRMNQPAPAASVALIGAPSAGTPPPAAPPPPAGAAELAIFAPIVVGSTSKGWKIEAISAVHGGAITVRFVEEKGRGVVDLFVTATSDEGPTPPATTGPYAIFYSARRALPEDGDRLAGVLSRAIEKNKSTPVPPGLTPYKALPQEHQPL
ncbi:MAG: hypothetical protein ABJE95_22635 [Byssovorax sp.]